ncbi:Wadjet anti-phage system protein JetD domain-containing protein [Vibrio breoganii]|uniref:Wadjet anti-phage system protein JetD domain-containing protein n=1 Tax=Vibrio breoganii TaxID=553239 RepID=UPI000C838768|nr:DUF3322 and DUF2220 domain-containing protein [Vibrio breoganii]PMM02558.1 hypothetical protein BCT64_17880 [Vibrio breoganii]PMN72380.1 hypothetical protein BCT28_16970 [Vibrio breoganii]
MAELTSLSQIRNKLLKRWEQYHFHQLALMEQPHEQWLQVKLPKITGKQLLHEYQDVIEWLDNVADIERHHGVQLVKQQVSFTKLGKQNLPVAIRFADMESLARYLGKWQQWQGFHLAKQQIVSQFPQLMPWVVGSAALVDKHQASWPNLLKVCEYFTQHPRPNCYIRQLDITGVDTKFIEKHKSILKLLLDQLLDDEAIDQRFDKMAEHGFEQRFGLKFDPPMIRFRLLDPQFWHEFAGMSDITLPLEQFTQLDLMIDQVYITENKINGLAFPKARNAIVIFGLGYGIQSLKSVPWLTQCQIRYWGDIDTHGFAILSQLRSYFPHTQSMLMDEATLLACKGGWGTEKASKAHKAERLNCLTASEAQLYHDLKTHRWQPNLRLEQEQVPMHRLEAWLG